MTKLRVLVLSPATVGLHYGAPDCFETHKSVDGG